MKFSIGQKVVFLYEEGGGEIKSITQDGLYEIEDEFGFNRKYKASELASVHSIDLEVADEVFNKDQTGTTEHKNRKSSSEWLIDLHIEELVEDHSHMSNYDILQLQMRKLRSFILEAQDKKVRKVIVVHGVGEGVLKHEVVTYLRGIEGSETFDGNYWEYGQGATVAILRYKY